MQQATYHMKKKDPVTRAGYLSKNPTGAIFASLQQNKKHDKTTTLVRTATRTTWPSQNEGNGPHLAESLPSAGDDAVARHGRRASFLEVCGPSSSRTGRSCLPQTRLPPSPTAPIVLRERKEALLASLGSLWKCGREEKVVARDSTRDSMKVEESDQRTKRTPKQCYSIMLTSPLRKRRG